MSRATDPGHRIVITGGSGGIGTGIARAALDRGHRVVLVDRDAPSLRTAARTLGPRVETVELDITDEPAVARWAEADDEPVDALVNNAGIFRGGTMEDLDVDAWRAVIEVNLTGTFIMSKHVGRRMIARGQGSIVGIASVGSLAPSSGAGAYSPSKAGVAMLMQQLAVEWGRYGVRANSVSPGFIRAGLAASFYDDPQVAEGRRALVPAARLGSEQDVADVVLFLCSPDSSYVNGQNIAVDGGLLRTAVSHAPRYGPPSGPVSA